MNIFPHYQGALDLKRVSAVDCGMDCCPSSTGNSNRCGVMAHNHQPRYIELSELQPDIWVQGFEGRH